MLVLFQTLHVWNMYAYIDPPNHPCKHIFHTWSVWVCCFVGLEPPYIASSLYWPDLMAEGEQNLFMSHGCPSTEFAFEPSPSHGTGNQDPKTCLSVAEGTVAFYAFIGSGVAQRAKPSLTDHLMW